MLKNYRFKIAFTSLLLLNQLHASDVNLGIDGLLSDIEKKTDLSEKTKLENSGISVVYTRDELQRMQAKYLKDVLKSASQYGYSENRYGGPDPFTDGGFVPFISTAVRVYIDNQEISSGLYGSGMLLMGDLNIGFVDHIEFYIQTPTYEYSTEPTLMLIKLYSRSTLKDEGSKVELNFDSYGSSRLSGYSAQDIGKNWSYFAYASANNQHRAKPKSLGRKLSRDKNTLDAFATFSNNKSNIVFNLNSIDRDAFIGPSYDATPVYSKVRTDVIHLGYDTTFGNFSFLSEYDYLYLNHRFKDDDFAYSQDLNTTFDYLRETTSVSHTASAELKYKKEICNNKITLGAKYRVKNYKYTKYDVNAYFPTIHYTNPLPAPEHNSTLQSVSTAFIEDQYSIKKNLILTLGSQAVNVKNIDATYNKNSSFFLYRFALTYLYDNWIFKTIGGHSEVYLEPYLVDSDLVVNETLDNTVSNILYEEIAYKKENFKQEFIFGHIVEQNYLMADPSQQGKINTYKDDMTVHSFILRSRLKYREYDELMVEFAYLDSLGMPSFSPVKKYKNAKAILRSLNTFNKFDVFNEFIYERDNIQDVHSIDFNSGLKYNYSSDMCISLKGENIFNRAIKQSYWRVNPLTGKQLEPLRVTPYDQKVTLSMEYTF